MQAKLLISFITLLLSSNIFAQNFDWHQFEQILKQHVQPGQKNHITSNMVNYAKLHQHTDMQKIAKALKSYDPTQLQGKQKISFYINAYNFYAIKMVADHWPVESIKDIDSLFSSVWNKQVGKINNKPITLNQIEHDILRKLAEPRIHFAIVCASMSCSDLRPEIYTVEQLEQQLEEQTKWRNRKVCLYILKK